MKPRKLNYKKYKTDKIPNRLIDDYERIFNHLRTKPVSLLEIGIFKGESLKLWNDFFPHRSTKIVGLDIEVPQNSFNSKITTYACNQNDARKLKAIAKKHGPFDIIIDDGAHCLKETENCFNALWGHVKTDGYYVIEDWAVGYWKTAYYKGMVDFITKVITKVPQLKISSFDTILQKNKAISFFKKGEQGWSK